MSRVSLKKDFKDGDILYGNQINNNNKATELAINDNYERIQGLDALKANVADVEESLNTKVNLAVFNDAINSLNTTKANVSLVNTKADKNALSLKADTTYVIGELAKKADTLYVISELSKKADSAYVNNNLLTKADTVYVNTQLANKANVSDLNNKVSTSELNTKLSTKADTVYVNTQLANKANTSTVGNLSNLKTSDKRSIVDAINSVQVGEIPIATVKVPGLVKPDGKTVLVDSDGTLSSLGTDVHVGKDKPTSESVKIWIDPDGLVAGAATKDTLGLVKPDGITIAINEKGVISALGGGNSEGSGGSYDDTELRELINSKADINYVDAKVELVADSISDTVELMVENGVVNWDYITNKPIIPTNISELENDRGYMTETDVNSAIMTAIGTALAGEY